MRELEFKAVDESGKEHILNLESYMGLNESNQEEMCPCELRDRLKQYTGKQDKNGMKVYEDDRLFNGYVFANVRYRTRLAVYVVEYPHHNNDWDYLYSALEDGFYVG